MLAGQMLAKGDKEALQSKLDYRNLVVIADELTINFDKLPELPVLPPHMQHLPYQHKSSVYHMPKSDALEAEHASHKRDEHVGDAVIRMFIADWIILEHPWIDVGVASVCREFKLRAHPVN